MNSRLSYKFKQLSLSERFFKSYEVNSNGCWNWIGGLDSHGYGQIMNKGVSYLAHRVSWEIKNGLLNDECVLHKCDNPLCVNPEHLFLGTRGDNNHDRDVKGRRVIKLTKEDVKMIRQLHMEGTTQKELSLKYNVTIANISMILTNKIWKQ